MRPGNPEDARACGAICYKAFKAIADEHHFPPDFPDTEMAVGLMNYAFSSSGVYSVIAEGNGQIVGSNFLWENRFIGGVGPITVDPTCQNAAVGRKLMEQVLHRAEDLKLASVRLVQAAYHNRSLSLYTKLGFDVREPLSVIQESVLSEAGNLDFWAIESARVLLGRGCGDFGQAGFLSSPSKFAT